MVNKWRDPNFIIYWSCLTVLLLLFLLAPRGCSQTEIKGTIDTDGVANIRFSLDRSLLQSFEKKFEAELGRQGSVRQDYMFFVTYTAQTRVDLSYAQNLTAEPLLIAISLPGTVVASNADRIEGNTAIWSLAPGKDHQLKLDTRKIRWWLIILVLICSVLALYARLSLRK